MIDARCPHCNAPNRHRPSSLGYFVTCAGCGKKYRILSKNESSGHGDRKIVKVLVLTVVLVSSLFICCGGGLFFLSFAPKNVKETKKTIVDKAENAKNESAGADRPKVSDPDAESASSNPSPREPKGAPPEKLLGNAKSKSDEIDPIEEEMVKYEIAKAEYHGWVQFRLGKRLLDEGKAAELNGRTSEGYKLATSANEWLRDVVKRYPSTLASEEANSVLEGQSVPDRPSPPFPKLPKSVTAKEPDVLSKEFDKARSDVPVLPRSTSSGSGISNPSNSASDNDRSGLIYVRGYTRKNGTYVAPHYRRR